MPINSNGDMNTSHFLIRFIAHNEDVFLRLLCLHSYFNHCTLTVSISHAHSPIMSLFINFTLFTNNNSTYQLSVKFTMCACGLNITGLSFDCGFFFL